jgi:hypothetical protein
MKLTRAIILGIPIGLIMGLVLFIVGATVALLFWKGGAPPGKFSTDLVPPVILLLSKIGIHTKVMSPLYFLFTKLIYGMVLGILFGLIYAKFHHAFKGNRVTNGLVFGLVLWFVAVSPIYPTYLEFKSELFWLIYSFSGFTTFGLLFGLAYRTTTSNDSITETNITRYRSIIAGGLSGFLMAVIAFIGAILTAIFWKESPLHYSYSQIFSVSFILYILIFNSIWGVIIGIVYRRISPLLSGSRVRSGLYFGFLLWLIRFSFDIVHKVCYTKKTIDFLLLKYIHPLVYVLLFGLLLTFFLKKFDEAGESKCQEI